MCDDAVTKQITASCVGFFVLSAIFDHLGSHVPHGSASFVAFGGDSFVQEEGQAEIDYVGFVCLEVHENILRFQVPVDHFVVVNVPYALQHTPEDV